MQIVSVENCMQIVDMQNRRLGKFKVVLGKVVLSKFKCMCSVR